jgi:GH24 family phage-related lysozyme (muramidase)
MKEYDITTLRNKHIDVFYRELSSTFSQNSGCLNEFDDLPDNVQLALFDMIFNLGQTRLRNIFRKFTLAIYNENWSDAATESYRPQVNRQRNDYVKELLLNVKKNQQAFPAQTER